MLDPRLFRTDLENTQQQLARRGFEFDAEGYEALEARRKDSQVKTQDLQNERNTRSKAIGQAKAKGEDIQPLLDEVQDLGDQLKAAETELAEIQANLQEIMSGIPNILDDARFLSGKNEDANVEISSWGEKREFSFPIKDHVDLGAQLRMEWTLNWVPK